MRSLDEFGCVEMSEAWQLDGTTARLIWRFGQCDHRFLRTRSTARQFLFQKIRRNRSHLQILGIETGKAIVPSGARLDAYVRGADLVAIYEESPPASSERNVFGESLSRTSSLRKTLLKSSSRWI